MIPAREPSHRPLMGHLQNGAMMNTENPTAGTSRAFALLSLAAAGTLALAACGPADTGDGGDGGEPVTVDTENGDQAEDQDDAAQDAQQDDAQDGQAQQDETAAEDDEGETSDEPLLQAIEAALAEHPDGVVTEADTDDEHFEIYVAEGSTEWELDIDRQSFEIVDSEQDDLDGDDQQEVESVEIDIHEALTTAAEEGGAEVEQASLDTEDGTVIWEIELTNDVEVSVDVTTGEVITTDS